LIRLKRENEEISDLLKLSPEEILLRWFNYHLENAGHNRRVNNFSSDLQDAENYTILLNQLDKSINKDGLLMNPAKRAEKVIEDSHKIGVPNVIYSKDIISVSFLYLLIYRVTQN